LVPVVLYGGGETLDLAKHVVEQIKQRPLYQREFFLTGNSNCLLNLQVSKSD
jgi:hypothetical protein